MSLIWMEQYLPALTGPSGFKRHLFMAHKQTTFKMAILEGVHKWSWNDLLNRRVVANPEQLPNPPDVNVG